MENANKLYKIDCKFNFVIVLLLLYGIFARPKAIIYTFDGALSRNRIKFFGKAINYDYTLLLFAKQHYYSVERVASTQYSLLDSIIFCLFFSNQTVKSVLMCRVIGNLLR